MPARSPSASAPTSGSRRGASTARCNGAAPGGRRCSSTSPNASSSAPPADRMRIDLYHLTGTPLEKALPSICEKLLAGGGRLLVVTDERQIEPLDRQLWTYAPESFLPHGRAGAARQAEQPILIGAEPPAANEARNIAIADGRWRDKA